MKMHLLMCPPVYSPLFLRILLDVKAILRMLVKAENMRCHSYTKVCNMAVGKDH